MKAKPEPTQHDRLTARGHDADAKGRCRACKSQRPARGGWSSVCPHDKRVFMGGEP